MYVVLEILKKIIPIVQLTIDDRDNYVVDVLGYKKQEYAYICWLYIVFSICQFSSNIECIAAYGYGKRNSAQVTE